MKPDWQSKDGSVQLFCGDCLEILPKLQKTTIDAVVTDPPYGINHPTDYKTRGRGNRPRFKKVACKDYPQIAGDDAPFDPQHLLDLRIPMILWGGNYYASRLPDSSGWLVWDKLRGEDLDQATCELAWTNCVKGVRCFRYLWDGFRKAGEHGEQFHPMQKPVALMKWCLSLRWTKTFSTICDPYMGSGSTAVACIRLGKPFIGIELVPEYFDIAKQRIERALHIPPAKEKERKGLVF